MLRFSDGMTINTEGEYRIERKNDGFYVAGNGMMIPADDGAEAQMILQSLTKKLKRKDICCPTCHGCGEVYKEDLGICVECFECDGSGYQITYVEE